MSSLGSTSGSLVGESANELSSDVSLTSIEPYFGGNDMLHFAV